MYCRLTEENARLNELIMTLRGDIHSAERAHSEQLQLATAALNSDWQAQLDAAAAGHASQLQAAADETLQQRQKTTDLEQKLLGLEENLADAQAMNRKQSDMLATAQRASDVTAQQLSQEKAERLEYENQVISLEKELCDFQQQVHTLQQSVDAVKDDMTATTQRCDAELAALKASHAAELSAEHERRTELQTQLDELRASSAEQCDDLTAQLSSANATKLELETRLAAVTSDLDAASQELRTERENSSEARKKQELSHLLDVEQLTAKHAEQLAAAAAAQQALSDQLSEKHAEQLAAAAAAQQALNDQLSEKATELVNLKDKHEQNVEQLLKDFEAQKEQIVLTLDNEKEEFAAKREADLKAELEKKYDEKLKTLAEEDQAQFTTLRLNYDALQTKMQGMGLLCVCALVCEPDFVIYVVSSDTSFKFQYVVSELEEQLTQERAAAEQKEQVLEEEKRRLQEAHEAAMAQQRQEVRQTLD